LLLGRLAMGLVRLWLLVLKYPVFFLAFQSLYTVLGRKTFSFIGCSII
jgi:hypothetical protein